MSRRAFSLLEVLIAAAVLSLALMPILSVVTASHGDSRSTLEESLASNLASELIEAVQALPLELVPVGYDDEVGPGTFAAAEAAGFHVGLASPAPGFTRRLKTETLAVESAVPAGMAAGVQERAASAATLLRIRVRVEWTSRGRAEVVQLVTARGRF